MDSKLIFVLQIFLKAQISLKYRLFGYNGPNILYIDLKKYSIWKNDHLNRTTKLKVNVVENLEMKSKKHLSYKPRYVPTLLFKGIMVINQHYSL